MLGLPLLGEIGIVLSVVGDLKEPLKIFPLLFSSRDWAFIRFFQPLNLLFNIFDFRSLHKSNKIEFARDST